MDTNELADIDTSELADIASKAAKGRKDLEAQANSLPSAEAERSRKLREENLEFRKQVERLSLALLNAKAIDLTLKAANKRFEEQEERFRRLEGVVANLDSELKNQKMIQVKALQATYGHGPTE